MRSTPFAAVCAIAIAACGTPVPPPRPAASPTRAEPAAPRAILALGTRDAVFLPDGRVAMSVGRAWHLFSPEHPEEGELFSFVGKMHVAGKHVFGVQVSPTNELVELDERFQVIHRLDLGALPLVDTTDDGEYFTAAPNQVGVLYRTRDWKPLVDHVAFTSNGTRTVGRMATTPDGRYAVTSRDVVDLVSGKKVFSHPALRESAWLVEGQRFHWVFRDLAETVDLTSGSRSTRWLPCSGQSATDPEAKVVYTACADGLLRTPFGPGAARPERLPLAPPVGIFAVAVEQDGRVVVGTELPPAPDRMMQHGRLLAMARGGTQLRPASEVPSRAGAPRVEPPAWGPGAMQRVRLVDGTVKVVPGVDASSPFSPDGRYVVAGTELVTLESGARVRIAPPEVGSFDVRVRDGSVTLAQSGSATEILHEIRLAPSRAAVPKGHVRITHGAPRPEGDVVSRVVVEDETGKEAASFTTTASAEEGEVWGDGVLLHDPSHQGSVTYCTLTGTCKTIHGEPGFFGLGSTFSFVAGRSGKVITLGDLTSDKEARVQVDGEILSLKATDGGVYATILDGATSRRLFVSAMEGRVTKTILEGIEGSLVGETGDLFVVESGRTISFFDRTTSAPRGFVLYSKGGYLRVHEDGRYETHGDAEPLLPGILCTAGPKLVPRAQCRRP